MIDWDKLTAGSTSAQLPPQAVSALDNHIKRAYPAIRNLVLIRKGELILSRAYDREITFVEKKLVRSVTKSVMSCLIGIALDQGKIKSTDQTLTQRLPQSKACAAGSAAGQLTLHEVLSMTGGMRWQSGRSGNEPMHARFMRSADWVESILSNPIVARNRQTFQYNTGLSHMLSAIISASTGMSAAQFAEQTLFRALSIDDYEWPQDPQANSYGGWGLEISSIDMAKFGMLYVEKGEFRGQRVVSADWVLKSTHAHTPGYGYQWWLHDFNGDSAFCAMGLGGQTIAVISDNQVVMVLTSAMPGRNRDQIELLRDHVYRLIY